MSSSERITQSMLSGNLLADITSVQNQLSQSQQELSSGKRILQPSDDPFGTGQALLFRADLSANSQYQTNVNDGSAWLTAADTALGNVSSDVLRVRDLVVQAANTTQGPQANQAIAAEVDQLIDSVKTEGNTQYAGQYIFAGTKTSTVPYTVGGSDAYAGDTGVVSRQIGPGVQLQVNVDGASVIGDGSTPGSLLAVLRQISSDLKTNDTAALGTTDLKALDAANDTVSTVRATIGARANRLTTALSRLQQAAQSSTQLLSNVEDADMAQTITNYSQQQAVYQAALKAGAQIIQPSLMDFLP